MEHIQRMKNRRLCEIGDFIGLKVIERENGNPFGIVGIRIEILITFTCVVELDFN